MILSIDYAIIKLNYLIEYIYFFLMMLTFKIVLTENMVKILN